MEWMKSTICKISILIAFLLCSFVSVSQNVQTIPYATKSVQKVNKIENAIGKTSYQIDRSVYLQSIKNETTYVNAYYYYIWFYNESIAFDGYDWKRVSTYIQSINIYADNVYVGNYYLLITKDFYYITIWCKNPKANIVIEYSKPIPYF